jgi:hypothetical protein
MTTFTTHHAGNNTSGTTTTTPPTAVPVSKALQVRRGLIVAMPVLAGIFLVVGAAADPAAGIAGARMNEIYIDNPDALQWKSTGYHWAYALMITPAMLLAGYVRGRGAWIANIAAVIGFLGATTLPGMLMSDWYVAGIGHFYGLEGVQSVEDHMFATMWGVKGFVIPGMVGFMLALPLATIALWRARLVRWWAFAAVLGAYAAFLVSGARVWGAAISLVLLCVFAFAIARASSPRETFAG